MENSQLKGLQAFTKLLAEDHGFEIKVHEHEAAFNMEEMREKVTLEHAPLIKNIFYKKKKGGAGFAYLMALDETDVKRNFWKEVNMSHNHVRNAKDEDLEQVLGCYRGCVNPLSLVNDTDNQVQIFIADKKLQDVEWYAFHPGDNTATIEIKRTDFEALMQEWKRDIYYLDLEADNAPNEGKGGKGKKGKKGDGNKQEEEEGTKLKILFEKEKDFANWYTEIIKKSDLIEYYDVSGCYVIKPHAYYIWESIQKFLDIKFAECGTQNCYFPMFVTKAKLEAEEDHIEGFAPEVAWVTRAGKSELAEPIAIRPTSETIMYPVFSKWIRSHRDLPLKVNQWTNVIRWEFSNPTPFIRTREFLWQEGHTAHATAEEADQQARFILQAYADCYREVLCVPVIQGMKSNTEKFAGGDYTYTCETFSSVNGRSIQACTSHVLGQNFAKMFNVTFQDKDQKQAYVHQTSWGFSTRSIGAFIMVHSDNKGLVLTPACADVQVTIVPIYYKNNNAVINAKVDEIFAGLKKAGVRVSVDDRENYSPGFRFNCTEVLGIPVRLEFGPKDLENNEIRLVRRFDNSKRQVSLDNLAETLKEEFKTISELMYNSASEKFESRKKTANNWEEFMTHLNNKNIVLTPWCGIDEEEEKVKAKSAIESKAIEGEGDSGLSGKAKTLCRPLDQEKPAEGTKCFFTGLPAVEYIFWGRSY